MAVMMNRLVPVLLASFVAAATVAPSSGAGGVDFASIAPRGSAFVMTARDLHASVARFDASPLGQILHAPELETIATARREAAAKERAAALQQLGVEATEVPLPGCVGLSLFVEHNEELDAPEIGLLLYADYADRAELAAKIFTALIADMEKDAGVSFEEVEIQGGAKATRVTLPTEPEQIDPSNPQPPSRRRPRGLDALGEIAAVPEALYFVRVGTQFFASSTVATLEEAIASANGKGGATVASSPDWQGVNAILGEQEIAAVVLVAPIAELLDPVFSGPFAELPIVLKELFGDVRAVALGARGDDAGSMMSLCASAYMQGEKVGIMKIMSNATPLEQPPALLGEDALTYQRLNVRFGDIIAMIEDLLAALPDYQADAAAPLMQQYSAGLSRAFSCLGPGVFTVSHAGAGGTEPSQGFTAIQCSDEKAVNAVLATMLPSAGMNPRDFQGHIVYGGDLPGVEIGLGAGALVIGAPAAVEQALRASSDSARMPLSESALYKQCASVVASGAVVGWGYTDMAALLDENRKAILALDDELPEAVVIEPEGRDADGDALDVLVPLQLDPGFEPALEKIDEALLKRYVGPLVWDVRSEPKALTLRFSWLRPAVSSPSSR